MVSESGRKMKRIKIWQSYALALLLIAIFTNLGLAQNNPIEDFSFKVQISSSFNKQESIIDLQEKFGLTEEVIELLDKNSYKYAIGNFSTYSQAAAHRDKFIANTGNKKAFIIAVKSGKILTNWTRNDVGIIKPPDTDIANYIVEAQVSEDTVETMPNKQSDSFDIESLNDQKILKKNSSNYGPFPINIVQRISDFIEINFTSSKIILLAVICILLFLFSFTILIILLFIRNIIKNRQEKQIKHYREYYQNILTQYLFSDKPEESIPHEFHGRKNSLEKEALITEMLLLHKTLSGEIKKIIQTLYLELALHSYSMKKLESKKWHVKAQGINELSQMNVNSSTNSIVRMLDSDNEIIRMESQCAIVNLHKSNPFSFLDHLKHPLTEWEKLNIHYLTENAKAKIPQFKNWLNTENDSLIIFCLQMIALYKQNDALDEVEKLFTNTNEEVRKNAYIAADKIGVDSLSDALKEKYADEEVENRLKIIKALGNMSDYSNLDFMENKLQNETDFATRLKLASSILKYGRKGKTILSNYLSSNDSDVQRIVNHVLDNRI